MRFMQIAGVAAVMLAAVMASALGSARASIDGCPAAGAKVFAFSDGRISLNGKVVPIAGLKQAIEQIKPPISEFCYSRQNPAAAPAPQAMAAMEVIASFRLPVSFYNDETFTQRIKLK